MNLLSVSVPPELANERWLRPLQRMAVARENQQQPADDECGSALDFSLPTRARARLDACCWELDSGLGSEASSCASSCSKVSPMSDTSAPLDLSVSKCVKPETSAPPLCAKSAFTPIRLPPAAAPSTAMTPRAQPIKLSTANQSLLCQLANYDLGTLEALISLSLLSNNPALTASTELDATTTTTTSTTNEPDVSSLKSPQPDRPVGSSRRKCKTTRKVPVVVDVDDDGSEAPSTTLDAPEDHNSSSGQPYVTNPCTGNKVKRNYKNMTRERRIEANARERTRVHTIGAAFDALRAKMPMVTAEQKLSKLSILRIACAYILLLAALNGQDYSADQRAYSVDECLQMLHETISNELKPAAPSTAKSSPTKGGGSTNGETSPNKKAK